MKCPKCGYERQPRDHVFVPGTECPACGIVYSKYATDALAMDQQAASSSGTFKKPSPVHEDTLKQARERVEKRLRAKSTAHLPDEHRDEILARARLFAAEGVRKRQQQWQLQQPADHDSEEANGTEAATAGTTPEAEAVLSLTDAVSTEAQATDGEEAQEAKADVATLDAEIETPPPAAAENDVDRNEENDMQTAPDEQAAYAEPAQPDQDEWEAEAFQMSTAAEETNQTTDGVTAALMADVMARNPKPNWLMGLLPTVAWLILVAGIVGAILSWTTLDNVYAGPAAAGPAPGNNLPIALLLGFAYLATGVLGFAFFWVSSMINGQLKEIRHLIMLRPESDERPETVDTPEA